MNLPELGKLFQDGARAVQEVLDAQKTLKEAERAVASAKADEASCRKRCEGLMTDAMAAEKRAAQLTATAEQRAKETDQAARAKADRLLNEANGRRLKVDQYVEEQRRALDQLKRDSVAQEAELVALKAELASVRQSIHALVNR